ncbi:MAG: methyltransferase family protein [Candidatus Hodarchaeales archaeon]|jgi:protein-S-isoprenylcysteine O-methyltransferase Ste14
MIEIKGYDNFRDNLPGYQGKKIILFPILGVLSFLTGLLLMLSFDLLPRLFPRVVILQILEPILPIAGAIVCELLTLILIVQIWRKKEKYLRESRETAYQRVLLYQISSMYTMFALISHSFIPLQLLPPGSPVNSMTVLLSNPLLSFTPELKWFESMFRLVFFIFFLFIGVLSLIQAIRTFGIDYLLLVHLIYPEESELQNNEIFSVIRHPTYSGGIMLIISAFFLNFSVYTLVFLGLVVIFYYYYTRNYEEKELIERFGESYLEYKKRVPAFIPRPMSLRIFFKYLLGRGRTTS